MTGFKCKFMVDKLLELLEYIHPVGITIEDVMGEYMCKGHIKVDDHIVRILHADTAQEIAYVEKCDIQAITYDAGLDYATIQLSIRRV